MSRTYKELCDQAVVNFEFWTGDIQNRGTAAMAMSVVGTPYFQRIGKMVGLTQKALADGITSGNVAAILDVTGTFTLEMAVIGYVSGTDFILINVGAGSAGGFVCYRQGPANNRVTCELYTIAGASARTLVLPVDSSPLGFAIHTVLTSTTGGTAGAAWVDGLPVVVILGGAGVAANHAGARPVGAAGGNAGIQSSVLIRAWQGALDANEVATLYNAYSTLTVPSKV